MTDSIETSEREIRNLDLRTDAMRTLLLAPADLIAAHQGLPAADQPSVRRERDLAGAVRLALVLLKDDQATADDRALVVAELERCLGMPPETTS